MSLEDRIIEKLSEGNRLGINDLCTKLGVNRNKLIKTYKQMIKNEILEKTEENNKTLLSIKKTDFDDFFVNFEKSIDEVDKYIKPPLNLLKKYKPLFKNVQKVGGNTYTYSIDKQARVYLDIIVDEIDALFLKSATLTFAESMDLVPKTFKKSIAQFHKKSIQKIKDIIELVIAQHTESKPAIRQHLLYRSIGYRLLSPMEDLSKPTFKNQF